MATKTKKAAKKAANPAKKTKTASFSKNEKFSFVDDVLEGLMGIVEVDRKGEPKIKKADLKMLLESSFEKAGLAAASGQRVRLPVIGILARTDVKARKAGKGINPFTGEETMVTARPASKKPRWSFPKALKEVFAEKKNW